MSVIGVLLNDEKLLKSTTESGKLFQIRAIRSVNVKK